MTSTSGYRTSTLVHGHSLSYVEVGEGATVLFLHGNPTSSFLWRGVLPVVAEAGWRCVAVDNIGMGDSDKPDIDYILPQHLAYIEEFILTLRTPELILVGHDWGAVMALALLGRQPQLIRGVAFMEGHIRTIPDWADMDEGGRSLFQSLREPGTGERLVYEENFFIEKVLPGGIVRQLEPEEMDAYRAPYLSPNNRKAVLQWPREIPIAGEPAHSVRIVEENQRILQESPAPKLLLYGTPGAVIDATEAAWCRDHARNLEAVSVGPATHFLPEDQPDRIARELVKWLSKRVAKPDQT